MKMWRYRWLRRRGYRIHAVVDVRLWDDLFSHPPIVIARWAKLEMRRGFVKRVIRFRRFTADELNEALSEDAEAE